MAEAIRILGVVVGVLIVALFTIAGGYIFTELYQLRRRR